VKRVKIRATEVKVLFNESFDDFLIVTYGKLWQMLRVVYSFEEAWFPNGIQSQS
jgi:hypothetical protein